MSNSKERRICGVDLRQSDEIRVLDILPPPASKDGKVLRCNFRPVRLTENGASDQYETLSYVWGDQSSKVPINISGRRFDVTKSLQAALQRIQLPDRKRTLWVDQICINQSDVKEKAAQVHLMEKIYSSCSRCLVWLGDIPYDKGISLEDAEGAFDIIRYIASASIADQASNVTVPSYLKSCSSPSHTRLSRAIRAIPAMSRTENPWWRRIWTIQEVALPTSVSLLWGPLSLPWDTIHQASRVWTGEDGSMPQVIQDLTLQSRVHMDILVELFVHTIWLHVASCRIDSPLYLFRRWRDRLATEPRDKVYGLLGLLKTRGSLPIVERCTYEIPVSVLFSVLTVELIMYEHGLLPLVNDPRLEVEEATEGMPSWALDVKRVPIHDTDWYHIYGYPWYNADNGLPPLHLADLLADFSNSKCVALKLKGFMIDVVQEVSQGIHCFGYGTCEIPLHTISAWYDAAQRFARHDQQEAFSRLLLGDLIRDPEQMPIRRANAEDVSSVSNFLNSGQISIQLRQTIFGMTRNQTFFVTKGGLLGLGHLETKPGDQVWIFRGGKVPFTIRAQPKSEDMLKASIDPGYTFVGRTYVQGIMQGETVADRLQGEVEVELY